MCTFPYKRSYSRNIAAGVHQVDGIIIHIGVGIQRLIIGHVRNETVLGQEAAERRPSLRSSLSVPMDYSMRSANLLP